MSVSNKFQLFLYKHLLEVNELDKKVKENPSKRLLYNQLLGFKKGIIIDIISKINNNEIMRSSQFNNLIFNFVMPAINNFKISKEQMFNNFNTIDYMTNEQKNLIKEFCEYSKKYVRLDVKKIYLKIIFDKILIHWLTNSPSSSTEKNKAQEIAPCLNSLIVFPQLLNFETCNEKQVNSLIVYFKELVENYKIINELKGIKKIGELRTPNITNNFSPKPIHKPKKPKYKKTKIPKKLRIDVWDKYIGSNERTGNCYVCNYKLDITDFEAGHIIAEVNGGSTNLENLRPTCKKCNRSVRTMNMNEYKQKYYG